MLGSTKWQNACLMVVDEWMPLREIRHGAFDVDESDFEDLVDDWEYHLTTSDHLGFIVILFRWWRVSFEQEARNGRRYAWEHQLARGL